MMPMTVEEDMNMTFKVSEQLYRQNSQITNTTSIDNFVIKLGYRQYNEDETPEIVDNIDTYEEDDEEITYDEDQGDNIIWN